MHFSRSFKKILGILCSVLLCATFSLGRAGKKIAYPQRTTTKSANHQRSTRSSRQVKKAHSKSNSRQVKRAHGQGKSRRRAVAHRGQRGIQADRAREIQQALIREKYLDGEASGVWDQRTKAALTRYQGDNGWQTKVVPDSRALIKLGLGPKHADVINPESVGVSTSAREMLPGGGQPQ